jgi:hypothetical protein
MIARSLSDTDRHEPIPVRMRKRAVRYIWIFTMRSWPSKSKLNRDSVKGKRASRLHRRDDLLMQVQKTRLSMTDNRLACFEALPFE